jgi:putative membrane protein
MIDYLIAMYPWLKAGHIISVISWMAGIFYLPRLFVHHSEKVEVLLRLIVYFPLWNQNC